MTKISYRPTGDESGPTATFEADGLSVYIGATPKTYWLNGIVESTSGKGYLVTGQGTRGHRGRPALPFETSMVGVFSCGDVRCDSTKRIASGVGEGSVVVQQIRRYLQTLAPNA